MARLRRPPAPDTGGVPGELMDPAAEVWRFRGLYVKYMADHGWSLPPQERLGRDSSTENRRYTAIEGWGLENGIATEDGQYADWHRLDHLRRAGGSTERTVPHGRQKR